MCTAAPVFTVFHECLWTSSQLLCLMHILKIVLSMVNMVMQNAVNPDFPRNAIMTTINCHSLESYQLFQQH